MKYQAEITFPKNSLGMHTRTCSIIAQCIEGSKSTISFLKKRKIFEIDTTRVPIINLMIVSGVLGLGGGTSFNLICEGEESEQIFFKLKVIFTAFGCTFKIINKQCCYGK